MTSHSILGSIENVVVLMFENRSFDNVLGGLRPYSEEFDGVPPGWSNPNVDPNSPDVPAYQSKVSVSIVPHPNPEESHKNMMEQIDGGSMKGFVKNYAESAPSAPEQIMQYYRPGPDGDIPITSILADHYAVSDRYFCSGPVQTWANRILSICATPGKKQTLSGHWESHTDNKTFPWFPFMRGQLDETSIFELFDRRYPDKHKPWKVYYDGSWPVASVVKYVHEHWHGSDDRRVFQLRDDPDFPHESFFADVENDTLPTFSIIEPRYYEYNLHDPLKAIPPNSNHPGTSTGIPGGKPIDIRFGEDLLREIYLALAAKPEVFKKTLLIVTYDEHGGCFDHVNPSMLAKSPFTEPIENYPYDSYGLRVPTFFINPYIKPGSVLRPMSQPGKADVFDHTSIIATLREHFDLGSALTPRDDNAPVFEGLIDPTIFNEGPLEALPEVDTHYEPFPPSVSEHNESELDPNSLGYIMYHAVKKRQEIGKKR